MIGKADFMPFSLTGAANHVLRVGDQWENRARAEKASFRTTSTAECQECPHLRKFPFPVQKLSKWPLLSELGPQPCHSVYSHLPFL